MTHRPFTGTETESVRQTGERAVTPSQRQQNPNVKIGPPNPSANTFSQNTPSSFKIVSNWHRKDGEGLLSTSPQVIQLYLVK